MITSSIDRVVLLDWPDAPPPAFDDIDSTVLTARQILVVRSLEIVADPNGVSAALDVEMTHCVDQAARPASGRFALDAPSVLFEDEDEMLAAFLVAHLDGSASHQWWWDRLGMHSSAISALLTSGRPVAAIVARVRRWLGDSALEAAIKPAEAMAFVRTIVDQHHLDLVETATMDASSSAHIARAEVAVTRHYDMATEAPTLLFELLDVAIGGAPVRPKAASGPSADNVRSSPQSTVKAHDPDLAVDRTSEAPQVTAETTRDAAPVTIEPRAIDSDGSPRPDQSPVSSGHATDETPVADPDPVRSRGEADRAATPPTTQANTRTTDIADADDLPTSPTSPRPIDETPNASAQDPLGEPIVPDVELVGSAYAGVFYLVNPLLSTELEAADLAAGHPWEIFEALARAVLVRSKPDPLWPMLARLAGRDPEAHLPDDAAATGRRLVNEVAERLRLSPRELRSLVAVPGHVELSDSELTVYLPLASIDIDVRRRGMDTDPGWVPALGRIIRFAFDAPRRGHR